MTDFFWAGVEISQNGQHWHKMDYPARIWTPSESFIHTGVVDRTRDAHQNNGKYFSKKKGDGNVTDGGEVLLETMMNVSCPSLWTTSSR